MTTSRAPLEPARDLVPPSLRHFAEPPSSRRAPPSSRAASSLGPARIDVRLQGDEPPIIVAAFAGRITLADITSSRDFGDIVKSLQGKPFRVLSDFTQTVTMSEDVCAVFVKAQAFAIASGMERDAFVCISSVQRLQFARVARESGRLAALGPLRFFEDLAEGLAHLRQ